MFLHKFNYKYWNPELLIQDGWKHIRTTSNGDNSTLYQESMLFKGELLLHIKAEWLKSNNNNWKDVGSIPPFFYYLLKIDGGEFIYIGNNPITLDSTINTFEKFFVE